jgi:superfamily II DNA or RNA helicase
MKLTEMSFSPFMDWQLGTCNTCGEHENLVDCTGCSGAFCKNCLFQASGRPAKSLRLCMKCVSRNEKHGYPWLHDEVSFEVERILGCRVMGKHSLKASPTKRKVKSERVERTEEVKLAVGDLGNGILVDDDTGTMERSAEDTAAGFMIVKRPRATSAAEPWPCTLENQLGGEPMDIDSEMTAGIGAEMLQDQQPSANLQSGGDQGQNTHKAQTENEDCRDRISIGTATKMNSCPVKPLLASGPGGLREACEGSTSLVIEIGDVNTNTDVLQMSSDMTEKSNGDISKAKEATKEVWQAMMCSSSDNQGKDRVVEANLESEGVRTDTKEVSGGTFPTGKSTEQELEFEFLVKWVGRSHIHNSWVSDSRLRLVAKRKLENYKSKYGTMPLVIMQDQWLLPMRILARQSLKSGSTEVLVKWQGLPYDECTWEPVSDPIIANNQELLAVFDRYEEEAYAKADRMAAGGCRLSEIEPLVEQPEWLKGGSLFPHQMEALNWLRKSWHRQKNVILADEMGLGKTISACAFLSSLHHEFGTRAPCLVLVPLSTMPNWLAEFSLWAPSLNVIEYHGSAKARAVIREYEWYASPPAGQDAKRSDTQAFKFNVMLTSYEMVIADSSQLRAVQWETLIVDEGHRLKNSESKLFNLLNTYSFGHRVLLTGTPLQNNLGEMYNLLNFLQPDTFPSLAAFQDTFKLLSTADQVEELKKLVAPHMLRRLKKDAMQNIPPKVERVVPVELTSVQAEYYRALLTKNYQLLRQVSGAKAGGQQQSMLNIMMQLRKVCNHPYLLAGSEPEGGSSKFLQDMRIKASAKLTLLHSMLQILKKAGHRVLIFSQMTKLLDILEDYLTFQFGQESFERVDGSVPVAERQAAIMRFNQDPSRFVFLLSTRSCGLGINLATADTVIIYDSDFNPHADIQAMNRAHRIGQSKTLLVYRMVVRASVEERILQLAKKKLMLDHLFASKSGSQKEIEDIIRWGTEELFHKGGGGSPQPEEPQSYPGKSDTDNGVNAESKPEKKGGFSSPTDTTRSAHGTESKDQLKKPVVLEDGDEDKSHKKERPKIVWDDAAVSRLLDRSELGTSNLDVVEGEPENDWLGSLKVGSLLTLVTKRIRRVAYFLCLHSG